MLRCPHCGGDLPEPDRCAEVPAAPPVPRTRAPRRKPLDLTPRATAELSIAEMRAYYKARAPYDDLRFAAAVLPVPYSQRAYDAYRQVEAGELPMRDAGRRYAAIVTDWRGERLAESKRQGVVDSERRDTSCWTLYLTADGRRIWCASRYLLGLADADYALDAPARRVRWEGDKPPVFEILETRTVREWADPYRYDAVPRRRGTAPEPDIVESQVFDWHPCEAFEIPGS